MSWPRRVILTGIGSTVMAMAGCQGGDTQSSENRTPNLPPANATFAYTHLQPTGNRVIPGLGAITDAEPVDLEIESTPRWLLAFGDSASYWTVVSSDGRATTHRVSDGSSELIESNDAVSSPPVAYKLNDSVRFVDIPDDLADHTHPIPIEDGFLYVAADGDLVIWRGNDPTRLDMQAPSDVRPVEIEPDRYALYGGKTDRYKHGALGDTIEGSSLIVVDTAKARIEFERHLEAPTVFEGLSPLVADLDGDGQNELLTTIADSANGARIRAYRADGTELTTGPVYGSGWRHQLCVAPFGPDDQPELAVVRKPHVERTVEFYRPVDGELTITATRQGYASHTYGSRNLDGGLAADLDSDGRTELLVPTTDRRTIDALRRVESGVESDWSLTLDGSLHTNITGVSLDGDRIAVGAGTADGVRVWQG